MPCGVYIWTFRRLLAIPMRFRMVFLAYPLLDLNIFKSPPQRCLRDSLGDLWANRSLFLRFLELLWAFFMIPLKLLKLHAYSCSVFLGIGFESFLHMHHLLCYREDDTCARGFQILSQGKDCKNMHVTLTI